jgi:LIM domain
MEATHIGNHTYHKGCVKCFKCKKQLSTNNYNMLKQRFYCGNHKPSLDHLEPEPEVVVAPAPRVWVAAKKASLPTSTLGVHIQTKTIAPYRKQSSISEPNLDEEISDSG